MESITLKILASDILSTNYTDAQDCAITRALARAGRPDLMDDANQIIIKTDTKVPFVVRNIIVPPSNEQYQEMQDAVYGMYFDREKYPIQDMEFTIIF